MMTPELEEVKILTLLKHNGQIIIRLEEEVFNDYEIYGFLKVYLGLMEDRFKESMCSEDDHDSAG